MLTTHSWLKKKSYKVYMLWSNKEDMKDVHPKNNSDNHRRLEFHLIFTLSFALSRDLMI